MSFVRYVLWHPESRNGESNGYYSESVYFYKLDKE